ncbi:MAG: hypothetical protein KJ593_00465 [Candidatus Omnitrophica bacterium]|nr:hypothetical protein [Candidatus Omnitrophota bacterium]
MVSFNDFKKLELKIAKIVDASDHPDADKLYVLKVNLGDKEKQLVAGIRNFYKTEELIGRQIVVVDNLEAATIRGVKSEGMLLAARDAEGISLLMPEREMQLGSSVM